MDQANLSLSFGTNDTLFQGLNLIYLLGIICEIIFINILIYLNFHFSFILIQIFLIFIFMSILLSYKLHIQRELSHPIVITKIFWDDFNEHDKIMHIKKHLFLNIKSNNISLKFKEDLNNVNHNINRKKELANYINNEIFLDELIDFKIYHIDLIKEVTLNIKSFFNKSRGLKINFKNFIVISKEKPRFLNIFKTQEIIIKGVKIRHQIQFIDLLLLGQSSGGVPIFYEIDATNIIKDLRAKRLSLAGLSELREMIIQKLNLEYHHIIEHTKESINYLISSKEISKLAGVRILSSLEYFK